MITTTRVIGAILVIFGLINLINEYMLYKKMINLKAGIDTDAPVYNFKFVDPKFASQSKSMTIYEASLKKDIMLKFYISQMRLFGVVLAAGIIMLILGGNKIKQQ